MLLEKRATVEVGVDQSWRVGGIQTRVLLEYRPTVETGVDQFWERFEAQLLVLLVKMAFVEFVTVEKNTFAKFILIVPPAPGPPVTPPPAPPAPCVFTTVPVNRAT